MIATTVRKLRDTTTLIKPGPGTAGIWLDSNNNLRVSSAIAASASATTTTDTAFKVPTIAGSIGSPVVVSEMTFTETTGAGTYTGSVAIPAGATIHDIYVNGSALWTATTSATLKVGDATDDDGYYTAVNLKATDLLAGESLSFALAGGKAGAYIANSQVSPRYSSAARTISAVVTTVGAAGAAGVTLVSVVWSKPVTSDSVAATKV